MASATMIEAEREGAEIYHGDATCEEKLQKVLEEFSVPRNLIYVAGLEEFGFKRSTGFFWLKQKSKTERKIKSKKNIFCTLLIRKMGWRLRREAWRSTDCGAAMLQEDTTQSSGNCCMRECPQDTN
ncbi:hypothetical protein ACS0TY_022843 [Phlomoides rotata]